MALKVKKNFSESDIQKRISAFISVVEKQQIEILMRLGEICITHAREIPYDIGFHDRTGNLRSSMGYSVFIDGVSYNTGGFQKVSAKEAVTDVVEDGSKVGESFCSEIGSQTKGLALVCVAGMNYAVYVESKGRDVLTSAEQLSKEVLPKMIERLVKNINSI